MAAEGIKSTIVGHVEVEYFCPAHGRCDSCQDENVEVRVGDRDEVLMQFCATCAAVVGTAMLKMSERIKSI